MSDHATENSAGNQPLNQAWLRERASSVQRWAHHALTAENLVAFFKTLAWVAPLTILIWIYAEREQVVAKEVTMPIAVKSTDPSRIVRLLGDQSITATLEGPNGARERVAELVQRPGEEPIVQIEIDRSFTPGQRHTIDTAQFIGRDPVFKSNGITVRDCHPPKLQVLVDEIAEREVPVRAPRNVTNLSAPPIFEPRVVKVRGPRLLLDEAKQTLSVEADLAGREELSQPGPHEIAALPLRASIDDPAITIIPATVHATIEVTQSDARLPIGSIPIWVSGPPGPPSLLEQYKVDYNPVLSNITLIGPPDKIEMLRKNPELTPIATLYVRREDIGKPMQDRRVKLDLPEGVYVAKEDEARLHVSFKLVALSSSE